MSKLTNTQRGRLTALSAGTSSKSLWACILLAGVLVAGCRTGRYRGYPEHQGMMPPGADGRDAAIYAPEMGPGMAAAGMPPGGMPPGMRGGPGMDASFAQQPRSRRMGPQRQSPGGDVRQVAYQEPAGPYGGEYAPDCDPAQGPPMDGPPMSTGCAACQDPGCGGGCAACETRDFSGTSPDEYLCDGGDSELSVHAHPDYSLHGLDVEDTIVHYDTLEGNRVVVPSNKVCIYSPRFGAVRQVQGSLGSQQIVPPLGVHRKDEPLRIEDQEEPFINTRDDQPELEIAQDNPHAFLDEDRDGAISRALIPHKTQWNYLPYENLLAIQRGIIDQAEKPLLAERANAAIAWSSDVALQVILDEVIAHEAVRANEAHTVYTIGHPGGHKLQVIKIASTDTASPGEVVDFTIRFDNVGPNPIGNVTLVDSLTTRLEYEVDSQQCSLKAEFSMEPNEAGSAVLRWEISDPIAPGDGGLVRFRCRVR